MIVVFIFVLLGELFFWDKIFWWVCLMVLVSKLGRFWGWYVVGLSLEKKDWRFEMVIVEVIFLVFILFILLVMASKVSFLLIL